MTPLQFSIEAYKRGVSVPTAEVFAVDEHHAPEAALICLAAPHSKQAIKEGLKIISGILTEDDNKTPSIYL